ncbi:hypothetical protein CP985_10900 [Malaciobacter mytili LMG 24559]|uniref:Uncharacterized protein n=1 Tax=Malaciobacter mytili LMG 24559 TaxID=1032238 RepID=A0AAX2AHP0_9BACT|nr:hypothetical protein [Malaciobacter mytili]AXH16305.1 putative membrane protein [Malaciobacter mytili LMG 24559]RXK14971.1 hypothetical protein CP985_10900 [Malaciobacter mytili LMG 24559]
MITIFKTNPFLKGTIIAMLTFASFFVHPVVGIFVSATVFALYEVIQIKGLENKYSGKKYFYGVLFLILFIFFIKVTVFTKEIYYIFN